MIRRAKASKPIISVDRCSTQSCLTILHTFLPVYWYSAEDKSCMRCQTKSEGASKPQVCKWNLLALGVPPKPNTRTYLNTKPSYHLLMNIRYHTHLQAHMQLH